MIAVTRTVVAVSTSMLGMLALAAPASAFTETFGYSGGPQTWTVPRGITEATFDLYGASGGGFHGDTITGPSLGGRAMATIAVTTGTSIQVTVGGSPPFTNYNQVPGFNGGGAGGFVDYAGGGATDIRIGGTALANRALVAGGGGGSANLQHVTAPRSAGVMAADCWVWPGTTGVRAARPAVAARRPPGAPAPCRRASSAPVEAQATGNDNSGGGGGGGWYGGGAGVTTVVVAAARATGLPAPSFGTAVSAAAPASPRSLTC